MKGKIKLGTLTQLEQIKHSQEWQGNMRAQVYKDKTKYTRKDKHKSKEY